MAAEGAAIAAIIANAIKASGVVVRVEPEEFTKIIVRVKSPLVVYCQGGLISTNHQYLTSYKGLAFYTKADDQIELPRSVEVIVADKIWIPS